MAGKDRNFDKIGCELRAIAFPAMDLISVTRSFDRWEEPSIACEWGMDGRLARRQTGPYDDAVEVGNSLPVLPCKD
jgi:hypothetical protein